MRIGCFGPIERLGDLARAGFREAELDICEVMALSEAEYRAFFETARATGLGFHAFAGLIPLNERFHSPAFDRKKWLTYAEAAAERTARLGCTIWPFGAGKCRSIPLGTDRTEGEKRVREFVSAVCRVVSEYGITLLIEPLGPANSNFCRDRRGGRVCRVGRAR
jgi:sugar phosphate isomerase/epimerase